MLNDIKIDLAVGDRLYANKFKGEELSHLDLSLRIDTSTADDVSIVEAVGTDFIVMRESCYGWPFLIVFDHIHEGLLSKLGYETQQSYVDALTSYWKTKDE